MPRTPTSAEPATVAEFSDEPSVAVKLTAELVGAFMITFTVIGTALFTVGFERGQGALNVGFLGVSLALGFIVTAGIYAFGPISGGHMNPAVTLGFAAAGRFAWKDVPGHIAAQTVGSVLGTTALAGVLAGGKEGALAEAQRSGFVSSGWGEFSPGGFGIGSFFIIETIATALYLTVILAVTGRRGAGKFAPLAIGLTLVVIAMMAIPVTNGSFNPARSVATALFGGGTALAQLWASIVAPATGALIAGFAHKTLFERDAR
ncbi:MULTISPECIES: aquaporin [Arthrobacter]|uniref:Aquaporin n=2 Tax=Arthrobacter TaxID=1663 RepID=A0ABU9KLH7_9MICC|nr:aquaporin [Arthrobacter sp. YJM1]MDP5227750.1 aquaporin [Arthrobacter sp. YJM1]